MWSNIAASKPSDNAVLKAINQRDRIAKHLTAAQVVQAQKRCGNAKRETSRTATESMALTGQCGVV
jgi:hypothetical protein